MRLHSVKRKLWATLAFSILVSLAAIIHGLFIDADITQIKRFSLEGFVLTFIVVFPGLLFLEWIFDLENKEEFKILEGRVKLLEKKRKK